MIKKLTFNPLIGNFDYVSAIPQLDTDPASPNAEDAWVRKTQSAGVGGGVIIAPLGLGFIALTPASGVSISYDLSYRTQEGTTKRVALT